VISVKITTVELFGSLSRSRLRLKTSRECEPLAFTTDAYTINVNYGELIG